MLSLKLNINDIRVGVWKITQGLRVSDISESGDAANEVATDLRDALAYVEVSDTPIVAIFHNVRQFVENFLIIQQTIDAANAARLVGSHIIFVGPHITLPVELKNIVTFIDCPLPNQEQIAEGYKQILNAYSDDLKPLKKGEDLDEVVKDASAAAIGLDSIGAENALALSLATTSGIDLNVIQSQKEQEVRKSDVLEFIPVRETMDDVGGFDAFKVWLHRRKKVFTKEAREYGLPYPKGMLIVGPAGCASGDTKIRFRRGKRNSGRIYTIEDAYYKFNRISRNGFGQGKHRSGDRYLWVDNLIDTQCLALTEDGTLKYHDIDSIVYSGIKEVYEVTTDSGRSIKVTSEHPFKVEEDGAFIKLSDLSVGDMVMMRDVSSGDGRKRNTRKGRRVIYGLMFHPYAWSNESHSSQAFARLVVEAEMNGMTVEDFIFVLKTNKKKASNLSYLPRGVAIHHKDEDFTNDVRENLEVMTKVEHDTLHGYTNMQNFRYSTVIPEKIVSIVSKGEVDTYDIIMQEPYRNYLAEDFVVHNSGKSLTAKAVASYLKLPLLRMDMGKIYRSLVGESEAATRMALMVAEAVSPVVLWMDEIEKGLAGMAGSGDLDSGVTARVVSTILTWRQETSYPVMLVATANNVTSLPSMVYRKGRLDEVWATDLPSADEREEIFKIHLRKRGRKPEKFGCKALASLSDGFTGSEIEGDIEDAMFTAFDQGVEVEAKHVVRAIRETIPQSVRDDVELRVIREWVANKARLVSSGKNKASTGKIRRIKTVNRKE